MLDLKNEKRSMEMKWFTAITINSNKITIWFKIDYIIHLISQ